MILTPTQVKSLQKCQAVANEVLPQVEWLERMAQAYPPIADRVAQVRLKRDMLATLAESALEADRVLSDRL